MELVIIVIVILVAFLVVAVGHGIWMAGAWLLRGGRPRREARSFEPTLSDDRAATARCLQRLRTNDLVDEATVARVMAAVAQDAAGWNATRPSTTPVRPDAEPDEAMGPDIPMDIPLATRLRAAPPIARLTRPDADALARVDGARPADRNVELPARPPAAAPPQRRPLSEIVAAFMAEKNIRWGELVGGLLIVGCSTALVVSLWAQIEAIPVLKFAIFTAVTTAIFGAGLFVHHRWKIPTTSHVLLIVATLLVPLNMLAFAAFSLHGPAGGAWTIAVEWLALLLFGVLTYLAGRVVVADSAKVFAAGVVALSGCTLAVRYFTPFAGTTLILAALAPVVLYVVANAIALRSRMRKRRIGDADARRTFIQLGVQSFACVVPFGLVVYESGMPAVALHQVAPLYGAFAAPALVVGLLLWRRLERAVTPQVRTAAASISLAAVGVLILSVAWSWPAPARLLPALVVAGGAFVALHRVARHPLIPALVIVWFTTAWVLGVHLLLGTLTWAADDLAVRAALASALTGQALVAAVIASAVLAAWFYRRGRVVLARGAGVTGGAIALTSVGLVSLYGFGHMGDPEHVVWVYALYAAALLAATRWVRSPMVACAGWLLAQAAISQTLVYIQPLGPFPWSASLLVGATLCSAALAWSSRRPAGADGAASSAPALGALALVLAALAGFQLFRETAPSTLNAFAAHMAWVAAVWLGVAALTRWPQVFSGGQLVLAVATVGAVQHVLNQQTWFAASQSHWHESRAWQAHAIALAGLGLVWQVARSIIHRRFVPALATEPIAAGGASMRRWTPTAARDVLHPLQPTADRLLTALALATLGVLALWSVATGMCLEHGVTALQVDAYTHAAGAGSWVLLGVVTATLVLAHRAGVSAAPLRGLVVALVCATTLVAANFDARHHVVTALRWLPAGVLALLFLLAQARGWWLQRSRPGRPGPTDVGVAETQWLVFLLLAGPVMLLTATFASAVGRQAAPLPAGMTDMALRVWLLGPMVLIVATVLGYARSVGRAAYAAAGAVCLCAAVTVVELSVLSQSGGRVIYADVLGLVQLNVIVSAAVALVWQVLARTVSDAAAPTAYPLGLLRANRVAVGVVLGLATIEHWFFPDTASPAVAVAGGLTSGLALIAAELALWLRQSRAPSEDARSQRDSVWAIYATVFLANALAPWDTGNWLCFHGLLVAFVVAGGIRLVLGAGHARGLQGPSWHEAFAAVSGVSRGAAALDHDLACTKCGYNLRGMAAAARCPECGVSVDFSRELALQRLNAAGAAALARVRNHVVAAVMICAAVATMFAVRAAFGDPQAPWWSAGVLVASGLVAMAVAAWAPRRMLGAFGGLQMLLAANVAWLVIRWPGSGYFHSADVIDLTHVNVVALAVAGLAWLVMEIRYLRPRVAACVPRKPEFHEAAAVLAVAGVAALSAVALGAAVCSEALGGSPQLAWLAWAAAAAIVLANRWDATSRGLGAGIYVLGLAAVLRVLAIVAVPLPTRLGLMALGLAAFAALASWAWRRLAPRVEAAGAPAAAAGWLPVCNGICIILATALACHVSCVHPATSWRLIVAAAPLIAAGACGLVFARLRRTAWQSASVGLCFLAGVLVAWAFTAPDATAAWLQRALALVAVAAVFAGAAGLALRWRAWLGDAFAAIHQAVSAIGAIACAAVAYVVVIEVGALVGHRVLPLPDVYIALGIIELALLIGCCAVWALQPSVDPLRAEPAQRGAYIYLGEVLAGVLGLHIRATLPWLFSGVVTQYWPMLAMGIAFAAAAGGEVCHRRGLAVLSRPLTRTGVLLPFVTLIELVVAASRVHFSLVLLCAGVLYAVMAGWRRSARLTVLAVVAFNGSLWYLLGHVPGLGLAEHPQLWFIPPALAVLAAGQLNRQRLTAQQLGFLHYGCLLAIYLSSTADIFLIGVVRAPWLPFVLAALSVAGVLVGFLARIRSFLMLGMGFLCLALLTMIWHAATNLGWTWLWYVAGIVLGAAIITVFALFEKKRSEMQKWMTELRNWGG